jgi:uncharacterized membrane protein
MKIPMWLLTIRLPIQFALMAWAWWSTSPPSSRSGKGT